MIAAGSSVPIDGLDASLLLRLLAMARGRNLPLRSAVEAASGLEGRPRLSRLLARLSAVGEESLLDELGAALRGGRDGAAASSLEALRQAGLPSAGLVDLSRWLSARAAERGRFLAVIGYPLSISVTACFLAAFLFQSTVGLHGLAQLDANLGIFRDFDTENRGLFTSLALLAGRFAGWLAESPAALLGWAVVVLLVSAGVFLFGTRIQDRTLALAIPGLRKYVRLTGARSFCGTLHLLLRSGVPAPAALDTAVATVANASLRRRLGHLAAGAERGEGLGELLRTTTALPPFVGWRLWSAYFRSDLVDELSRIALALDVEVSISERRVASLANAVSWSLAILGLVPVVAFVSGISKLSLNLFSVIG